MPIDSLAARTTEGMRETNSRLKRTDPVCKGGTQRAVGRLSPAPLALGLKTAPAGLRFSCCPVLLIRSLRSLGSVAADRAAAGSFASLCRRHARMGVFTCFYALLRRPARIERLDNRNQTDTDQRRDPFLPIAAGNLQGFTDVVLQASTGILRSPAHITDLKSARVFERVNDPVHSYQIALKTLYLQGSNAC
jgi:hypothetical protein